MTHFVSIAPWRTERRALALSIVLALAIATAFAPRVSRAAGAGPTIDDPLLTTTVQGPLTIHGANLGDAGSQRSVRFDYESRSATMSANSSAISVWQNSTIQLKLPPEVQNGQLTVSVDGVASNAVDLLVYSYSATSIPPTPGTNPFGLATAIGPGGTLWLNQEFHQELKSFSPATSPVPSAFLIPQASGPGIFASTLFGTGQTRTSELGEDITVDIDGKVWFTEGGWSLFPAGTPYFNTSRIVSYDPATSTFACYNAPVDDAEVVGLAIDQQRGMIWYAESGFISGAAITGFVPDSSLDDCSFDPSRGDARAAICTDEITTQCHQRLSLANPYSLPAHLAIDQNGNIWFTEFLGSKIGRLSPETGEVVELPLPAPSVEVGPGWFFDTTGPWALTFDPNGDLLISGYFDASILRVRSTLMQSNDCQHLDANGQNPCIDRLFVASDGTDNKVIHTVSLGADGLAWFGIEQDSLTDPSFHRTQLGFVATADDNAIVLLPEIPGLTSVAGIAQDLASHDVWFVQPSDGEVGRLHQLGAGDADGDGVPDASDNCVLTPNPRQEVAGSNSMGTACDYIACPDYDQDGKVRALDILFAARYYRAPRPAGGLFTMVDLLAAVRGYGMNCWN